MKTQNLFLIFVVIVYIVLGIFFPEKTISALSQAGKIFVRIIPLIFLIIILMIAFNYFFKREKLLKLFRGSKARSWLIAVITGILSSGPIYVWYPLLKDLMKKGIKPGLIAVFLYNRAVKIPLLPVMIYYFGLIYVLVLTVVMIIASILQGIVVNKVMENA